MVDTTPGPALERARATPTPTRAWRAHPVCAIFPLLDADDLHELADDIERNGLIEPIVVRGDQILDGRNRLRACEIVGLEPDWREWEGEEHEISAWILSKNLHRRHLTTSQRSMIAGRLATLEQGQRQTGQLAGLPTQPDAASLLNVGERSVRRAREVLEHGSPELVDQVDRGRVTVSRAAELVREDPRDREVLQAPERVVSPTPAPARAVLSPRARDDASAVDAYASTDPGDLPSTFPPRPSALPNEERAPNDGYWTPLPHALACVRWMADKGLFVPPPTGATSIVEPAVGGGAWVTAVRQIVPDFTVDRWDIDPAVPGLELDRRTDEDAVCQSWLEPLERSVRTRRPRYRRGEWSICLGNPPYQGDLLRFLEVSLERAHTVAFLLRETFTGTNGRLRWWRDLHRPSWIVKLGSRPKWEGPGARDTTDFTDTVLVVWLRGDEPNTETAYDWLEVTP